MSYVLFFFVPLQDTNCNKIIGTGYSAETARAMAQLNEKESSFEVIEVRSEESLSQELFTKLTLWRWGSFCGNAYIVICWWSTSFYQLQGNISLRFSGNSKAKASELLENIEEMFPCYYTHSNVFNMFKSSATQYCVILCKRLKKWINTSLRSSLTYYYGAEDWNMLKTSYM